MIDLTYWQLLALLGLGVVTLTSLIRLIVIAVRIMLNDVEADYILWLIVFCLTAAGFYLLLHIWVLP